jgi:hypothetical protein
LDVERAEEVAAGMFGGNRTEQWNAVQGEFALKIQTAKL